MKLVLTEYESGSALAEAISNGNVVVLEKGQDTPRRFPSVTVPGCGGSFTIVIYSGVVVEPSVLVAEEGGYVLVGYADTVAVISRPCRNVVSIDPEIGQFNDFLIDASFGIIAVFELGIARLMASGTLLWKYDAGDILTGWVISHNRIYLNLIESEAPVCLALSNGQLLQEGLSGPEL